MTRTRTTLLALAGVTTLFVLGTLAGCANLCCDPCKEDCCNVCDPCATE